MIASSFLRVFSFILTQVVSLESIPEFYSENKAEAMSNAFLAINIFQTCVFAFPTLCESLDLADLPLLCL